ncbi:MAG TPA: transposase, partial [Balneola sp.]|nr:transposase [Balneola sp.]
RSLSKSFRFELFNHIKDYSSENEIDLDIINGIEDHVHCLFRLKSSQNPAEVIKLIKGESSFWINKNVILDDKFEWQVGYGVFSVSEKD